MRRFRVHRLARTGIRALLAAAAAGFACVVYAFLTLPDVRVLKTANPATTAFIELRARQARAKGESPRRFQTWGRYERFSPSLVRAVLVAEDSAFWDHEGIDLEQIKESIEINIERGTFSRGASTITQQLAKNLYLSPSKNPLRKLRELFIARRLEAELTKRRILELYLNVIEWGPGIYGAEAGSRTYFGKSATMLTPDEAALLASAIPNPLRLNPARPTRYQLARQRLILTRMGSVEPPAPLLIPTIPPDGPTPMPFPIPSRTLPSEVPPAAPTVKPPSGL